MNDLDQWQQSNEAYLATALVRLRERLEQVATPSVMAPTSLPGSFSRRGWWQRKSRQMLPAEKTLRWSSERAIIEPAPAATAMTEAAAMLPPPALALLAQRFGLSHFEQEVLLLCAAMELDTRLASLCARAQDDPGRPYPTFALALALFDDPSWEALSPERPLRYWRFVEVHQPGAQPLITSALRADERIVSYLKGLNYLDDRLAPLFVPFDIAFGDDKLPASQENVVARIVRHVQQMSAGSPPPVTQLVGLDPLSKQLVAQRVAVELHVHLRRLPVELLPKDGAELETLARLWQRESFLLPVALYLDAHEDDGPAQAEAEKQPTTSPLRRFLARSQGLFFLSTRQIQPRLGPLAMAVEVDKPAPVEQQAAWADALEGTATDSPTLLAGQFNLNTATIRQIARVAVSEANGESPHAHVWDACLVHTDPQMGQLAQRLHTKATWGDIVLPEEAGLLLRQIAAQVRQRSRVYDAWGFRQKRHRGLGITALFAGDSGTGKTMAAEVIANDLRLNLYRIDLSAVVNKYIGETEKNLRRLFDAAEDGGAILFFDEADALFGKRSEIKDSHDRYANIEINYLLQRMEDYRGLAILATNMKSALDQAFMRRLRFIVNFPFPGRAERKAIWQKTWPDQMPRAGLDYDRLAQLDLAGGGINNIAVNAAFMAAQAGTPVTMSLVLAAARLEFRKLERPIKETDFRWQEAVGGVV
jgi:hypothetical protein